MAEIENLPVTPLRRFFMRWHIQLFFLPLFYGVMLFLAAGTLNWIWGWILLAFYFLSSVLMLLLVRDPGLIAEREHMRPGIQAWDYSMVRVYGLLLILSVPVAGLDHRFGWSPDVPLAVNLLGLLGLVGTAVMGTWSMRVNTYFSPFLRIQTDRGHEVVTSGPYRLIRHPGNLSMILWALGAMVLLGSLWALLPALLASAVIVARTAREDITLKQELPGYDAYSGQVRFRLLPGIW